MIDMDTFGVGAQSNVATIFTHERLHLEMLLLRAIGRNTCGYAARTRWRAFRQRDSGSMPAAASHGGAVLLGLQTSRCKSRCMLYGLCRNLRPSGVSGGVEL
jgi:hypothetical protein